MDRLGLFFTGHQSPSGLGKERIISIGYRFSHSHLQNRKPHKIKAHPIRRTLQLSAQECNSDTGRAVTAQQNQSQVCSGRCIPILSRARSAAAAAGSRRPCVPNLYFGEAVLGYTVKSARTEKSTPNGCISEREVVKKTLFLRSGWP